MFLAAFVSRRRRRRVRLRVLPLLRVAWRGRYGGVSVRSNGTVRAWVRTPRRRR